MEALGGLLAMVLVFWLLMLWVTCIGVAADFAEKKGRSPIAWGAGAAVFGPIWAVLAGLAPDARRRGG